MRAGSIRGVIVGAATLGFVTSWAAFAAGNGLEIPENGTEVMGRGGAWTARADTALAAALNPAGLAGQETNLVVNANLTWQSMCFQRAGTYPDAQAAGVAGTRFNPDFYGQPYPEVCKKNGFGDLNVVPQLGAVIRINERLGIGILPLWTPSGTGKAVWPDADLSAGYGVQTANGSFAPAPQRFLLLERNARIIMPTFAAGYELLPGVRVGAAFQWVITTFNSALSSQATQSVAGVDPALGPASTTRSEVKWTSLFTPAAVFGVLASPTPNLDIGAMFRWSADIVKREGDVKISAPYYGRSRTAADTPAETEAKVREFRLAQPMDLRLGVRWHMPRKDATAPAGAPRDFLATDVYDVELDLTYSRNSSFDQITILFPENQRVAFGASANASFIPPDASVPKKWKDTVGARLGGEYVVIPNQLGVRLGGFWQSKGQDEKYLNIDFHPGEMFGFYLGGTIRVASKVDIAVGYGRIFVRAFDNTATGGDVRALVGTPPAAGGGPTYPGVCDDPNVPAYRSCEVVNTGRLTSGYNMFSLGTTVRF
jgi:long-chain fatty acid transport protein